MQVLYRLLDNPEHIGPLREEVDAVISEEGWSKAATDKMYKIDSFVRETQRLDGIASRSLDSFPDIPNARRWSTLGLFPVAVSRLSLRPFTFSNGITVPAGTFISVPATAAQRDGRTFPNPDTFDGFRFAKLREGEADSTTSRYQAVSVSNDHLPFGVGRHTW
jgi:cytochrome P450